MKHLLLFISAVAATYFFGVLVMSGFGWILRIGFLGWLGLIPVVLWFFIQFEINFGGWDIEKEEINSWYEEYEDDDK